MRMAFLSGSSFRVGQRDRRSADNARVHRHVHADDSQQMMRPDEREIGDDTDDITCSTSAVTGE
jgi:hypothetical protein